MSGRRCGDLGERCKRSQRLQLDLACGPRGIGPRDPHPYMPKAPVSRDRKGLNEIARRARSSDTGRPGSATGYHA
jgi:hypothetical protein